MGADTFFTVAKGQTVAAAFTAAQQDARYEHGHGGYSGTIAEKRIFVMIQPAKLPRKEAFELAEKLIDDEDPRVADKWGPAGVIPIDDGSFLFFGLASS